MTAAEARTRFPLPRRGPGRIAPPTASPGIVMANTRPMLPAAPTGGEPITLNFAVSAAFGDRGPFPVPGRHGFRATAQHRHGAVSAPPALLGGEHSRRLEIVPAATM